MSCIPDLESKYILIKQIGHGKEGNVLKVMIKENNEKFFAVKELESDLLTAEQQKLFFDQIDILKKTNNPAIVPFIGFTLENNLDSEFIGHPALIFDFIPYSLDKLLKGADELPLPKKYIILLGIAEGMKYLHSIGIIQRDLKPGNILLNDDLYPFICDFGMSKIADANIEQFLMGSFKGSPFYMAPEVITQKYTSSVDIYSYSILFYHLFTGKIPFPNMNNSYLFYEEIVNGKRPDLKYIEQDELKDFLTSCWSTSPSERIPFKDIVEILKKKSIRQIFGVNDVDVNKYLLLFDDKLQNDDKEEKLINEIKQKADQDDIESIIEYANIMKN